MIYMIYIHGLLREVSDLFVSEKNLNYRGLLINKNTAFQAVITHVKKNIKNAR